MNLLTLKNAVGVSIDLRKKKPVPPKPPKPPKRQVLIYSGSLAQNGLTASLENLLANIRDDADTDYIITYRKSSVRDEKALNKLAGFKTIAVGEFMPSVSELVCYVLHFKLNITSKPIVRRLERMFAREWKRFYGGIHVDTAVQFTGYEYGVIKLFQQADARRVIFVHNDMVAEIKTRRNQHRFTLESAYRSYDAVAVVTEDMIKSTVELSGTDKNIVVVPNCHDYRRVLEKSAMPIEFQETTDCNTTLERLRELLDCDIDKFITIGRFSPEKAHLRLIDAYADYCRETERKSCLIIIGGRGELYEDTVKYAGKTGLDIVLIRSMENPMPVLKRCGLFMLPSQYEGLGLVLLEADTLGLPVFATDIPGTSCFLREHGGLLVENSREGILKGMRLYREGKINTMGINFDEYNKDAAEKFRKAVKGYDTDR